MSDVLSCTVGLTSNLSIISELIRQGRLLLKLIDFTQWDKKARRGRVSTCRAEIWSHRKQELSLCIRDPVPGCWDHTECWVDVHSHSLYLPFLGPSFSTRQSHSIYGHAGFSVLKNPHVL